MFTTLLKVRCSTGAVLHAASLIFLEVYLPTLTFSPSPPPAHTTPLFNLVHILCRPSAHPCLQTSYPPFVTLLSAPYPPSCFWLFFYTSRFPRPAQGSLMERRRSPSQNRRISLYLALFCRPYLYPGFQPLLAFFFPDPWIICSAI